ncbi:MAG TPA: cell wall hydrolase [Allosphingosinicella sp.]|jgi:spore germination cell wall hydrolase CwlJ-like protein
MSRTKGAAGIAAAIVFAVFGTVHATPSRAWQIDPAALTPAIVTTTNLPAPAAPAAQTPALPDPALDQPVAAPVAPAAKEAVVHQGLGEMVAERASASPADAERACLATAVYFEAKGEPLKGQLGVAHVILNRVHSGRFAHSVCGVVKQPGQFSFVHGGHLPAIAHGGSQWKTAVAIADIALSGHAPAPAPKALFFHARSVSPGWHLVRVAAIGNHVFYR